MSAEAQALELVHCILWHISRELHHKCSSWDSNQCLQEMLALQVAAQTTVLQSWLLEMIWNMLHECILPESSELFLCSSTLGLDTAQHSLQL